MKLWLLLFMTAIRAQIPAEGVYVGLRNDFMNAMANDLGLQIADFGKELVSFLKFIQ
jgi:hypothetical protein